MPLNTFEANHFASKTLSLLGHIRQATEVVASGMHRLMLHNMQKKALEDWAKKEDEPAAAKVESSPAQSARRSRAARRRSAGEKVGAPRKGAITATPSVAPSSPRGPVRAPEPSLYDWLVGVVPLPVYTATYSSTAVLRSLAGSVISPRLRSARRRVAAFLLMAA